MIRNLSPAKLPGQFWSEDKGLTGILILLCASNFLVVPFLSHRVLITLIIKVLWLAMLMAGIVTLSRSLKQLRYLLPLPVLFVAVNAARYINDNVLFMYLGFIVELAVVALLIGMVLMKVFGEGPVTIHRVIGAVVVYMLIGNLWANIYEFVYLIIPGSIQFPEAELLNGVTPGLFTYFSFTTLTTTGYGDILPVHNLTRTLVIVEQLIGVLFPAVLIGRLVSLVVTGSGKNDREEK